MKVLWTPEAIADRTAVWDYIAQDNPAAAARVDLLFSETAAKLTDFPRLGHPGIIAGTHELTPHKSYCLVYEIFDDTIWILAVVHAARRWPDGS